MSHKRVKKGDWVRVFGQKGLALGPGQLGMVVYKCRNGFTVASSQGRVFVEGNMRFWIKS